MATYTYTDPGTSDRDKVRFYVGDNVTGKMVLSDEEIAFLLSEYGKVGPAACAAARAIGARYATLADQAVGRVSVRYSQRSKQYYDLADELEENLSGVGPLTYAGGTNATEKARIEGLQGCAKPFFHRGLDRRFD